MAVYENFRLKGTSFFFSLVLAVVVMGAACLGVFFFVVNRPEQMMVPNVTGKELTVALLEMQVKELYPRLQLRYTNSAGDKGLVLEQDPGPGSIVKAGRRVTLTVSRGVAMDTLEDFAGLTVSEAAAHVATAFSGLDRSLVTFAEASSTPGDAPEGTTWPRSRRGGRCCPRRWWCGWW
jgi:beta-lactam-binding protein with PASTA domain